MWQKDYACIDTSFIYERLGISPLSAINAVIPCANGIVPENCGSCELPATFNNDMASAINQAVADIKEVTRQSPCGEFLSEQVPYPKHNSQSRYLPPMRDGNGQWKTVEPEQGYFLKAGRLKIEPVIEPLTAFFVEYTDDNPQGGDGYRDTATVSVDLGFVPDYDTCQIFAFFPHATDTGNFLLGQRFKPVRDRMFDGTTITLIYDSYNLVKPEFLTPSIVSQLYSNTNTAPLLNLCCEFDADDHAVGTECPFSTFCILLRVYIDDSECAGTITYNNGNYCGCGKDGCISERQTACIVPTGNYNKVMVIPAESTNIGTEEEPDIVCQQVTQCHCKEPDYVCIDYFSGCEACYPQDCYDPDEYCFKEAVYWLTLARLKWRDCTTCPQALNDINLAQKPRLRATFDGGQTPQGHPDIKNPQFGTIVANNYVGEVKAWQLIKNHIFVPAKKTGAVYR